MALGHASPEHYAVLFEELPVLVDEYQKPAKQKKGTARPEEVITSVARSTVCLVQAKVHMHRMQCNAAAWFCQLCTFYEALAVCRPANRLASSYGSTKHQNADMPAVQNSALRCRPAGWLPT